MDDRFDLLTRDVADVVAPHDWAGVGGRARRRRTTQVGLAASAAVVAGAVALTLTSGNAPVRTDPAPAPSGTGATSTTALVMTRDPAAEAIVRASVSMGRNPTVVAHPSGAVLALYDSCPESDLECPDQAAVVRGPDGQVAVHRRAGLGGIEAVPDGWVFVAYGNTMPRSRIGTATLVGLDGVEVPLTVADVDDPIEPEAGDVGFVDPTGALVYRPSQRLVFDPEDPPGDPQSLVDAHVTTDGTLVVDWRDWEAETTGYAVLADGRWTVVPVAAAYYPDQDTVTGYGDHVAVSVMTIDQRLERLLVSHDAGRTWTTYRPDDLGVRGSPRVAVAPDGTVWVVRGDGQALRVAVDGSRSEVFVSDRQVFDLTFADDGRIFADTTSDLLVSADDGAAWSVVSPPGLDG